MSLEMRKVTKFEEFKLNCHGLKTEVKWLWRHSRFFFGFGFQSKLLNLIHEENVRDCPAPNILFVIIRYLLINIINVLKYHKMHAAF